MSSSRSKFGLMVSSSHTFIFTNAFCSCSNGNRKSISEGHRNIDMYDTNEEYHPTACNRVGYYLDQSTSGPRNHYTASSSHSRMLSQHIPEEWKPSNPSSRTKNRGRRTTLSSRRSEKDWPCTLPKKIRNDRTIITASNKELFFSSIPRWKGVNLRPQLEPRVDLARYLTFHCILCAQHLIVG